MQVHVKAERKEPEKALHPLELELQSVVSSPVGAVNQTGVHYTGSVMVACCFPFDTR